MDTSESRSGIPLKFWNVVLEKKCGAEEEWADRVRNKEVSQRVKEDGKLKNYKEVRRNKVNWIGRIAAINVI
jgi:hypothetical protein